MAKQTPLQQAREAMSLSVRRVAEHLGLDISGLMRIERGTSLPKRSAASVIWAFYGGAVPLGLIYDSKHKSFRDWLTAEKKIALKAHARTLVTEYPELAESDRRKRLD